MGLSAYTVCHDCRQSFCLGKAVHSGPEDYKPFFFHKGSQDEPANWGREKLNQVLWKFMADHTLHHIEMLLEHDFTDDMWDYQAIGDHISLEDYLKEWRGLQPGD